METIKLFFCGDIMPGGVLPYQIKYMSNNLLDYMNTFDIRIGTLEAAIGTNLPFDPIKMKERNVKIVNKLGLHARPASLIVQTAMAFSSNIYIIKDEIKVDVLSLANNHIFDLGEEGLKNTIRLLKKNNIKYCGAGLNIDEASKPIVVEFSSVKIAFFSYCEYKGGHWEKIPIATEYTSGVNPLVIEKVLADIQQAKKQYDYVIVLPHWGQEYKSKPTLKNIYQSYLMIKYGADAILGSHSHQIQPLIHYKNKYICYSMGNFLFPDFYIQPPRPIFYPDKNADLSHIKDIYDYPLLIHKYVKRVWPEKSRFGYVLDFSIISKKIKIKKKLVKINKDNILNESKIGILFYFILLFYIVYIKMMLTLIAIRRNMKEIMP